MTATIIQFKQTSAIEDIGQSPYFRSQTHETVSGENIDSLVFTSRKIIGAELGNDQIDSNNSVPLSAERVYPHVFDESIKAGQAIAYLRIAINDANVAIDAFGEPDMETVLTRLTQIAAAMGKAHSLTDFNECLGAVVSYIRRATLAVSNEELTRSALNSLIHVLGLMAANPMMDLDEAGDLVDKLSNDGWKGEHGFVNELILALVDSSDLTADEMQILLHPDLSATEG